LSLTGQCRTNPAKRNFTTRKRREDANPGFRSLCFSSLPGVWLAPSQLRLYYEKRQTRSLQIRSFAQVKDSKTTPAPELLPRTSLSQLPAYHFGRSCQANLCQNYVVQGSPYCEDF